MVPAEEITGLGDIKTIAISPYSLFIYYIRGDNKKLYKIYLNSPNPKLIREKTRVGVDPTCMQLSPDGKTMYVLDFGTRNFIVVDLNTDTARNINLNGQALGCGCFVRYPK